MDQFDIQGNTNSELANQLKKRSNMPNNNENTEANF